MIKGLFSILILAFYCVMPANIWAAPLETGACCFDDGMICISDIEADSCADILGGEWMGDGSSCGEYDEENGWSGCQAEPAPGACCSDGGMVCTEVAGEAECVDLGGTWMGEGSYCGEFDEETGWDGCQTGACCFDDGMTCIDNISAYICHHELGGTWRGAGSACGEFNEETGWSGCQEPTGACCMNDGLDCTELTTDECVEFDGVWMGAGSACGEFNEETGIWEGCDPGPVIGACCSDGGLSCDQFTEDNCLESGGTWMGAGLDCGEYVEGSGWSGCQTESTSDYVPGDVNMLNGQWPPTVIGGDVTYLVNYFRGINSACLVGGFFCSADANGDCSVIGSDVTKMVSYFRGLTSLSYCANYEPTWLTPSECPTEVPTGWPNCGE